MPKISAKKAKELEQATYTRDILFDAKRDMNPYWRSSLFSEVYLKNDIPREYKHIWEHDEIADETSGFFKFYDGFLDLVNKHENSSFDTWKEAETVKNWIVPIMVLLGWDTDSKTEDSYYVDNESFTVTEKEKKQTYRPDLLYFEKPNHKTYTQNQTDPNKKLAEARDKKTGCKIVVEAKYWNKLSQKQTDSKKDKKLDDSAVGLGPDLQTLKYMEILELDFGILTDGKTWKLFHKELSQGVDRRSYTFDLDRLRELALDVTSYGNEDKYKHYAKYFYYFFSKQSFVQGKSKTSPFVYEVFNYSKKYATRIEEDLKKRFIITMGLTCNALKNSCEELGESVNLATIRNVAESHIFNILFVKSCEVRHVLPIRSIEYLKLSLHEVIESLDAMKFDPNKDEDDYFVDFQHGPTFGGNKFTYDGYQIFDRFINLYEIIHDGTNSTKDFGFEIEGFKESIFTKAEWSFAKKHKIRNKEMIKILFMLNFIESEFQGRKFQQIPYSYFTPRQLGSIYESFLEYRLEKAESGMVFTGGQWKEANIKSSQVKQLNLIDNHVIAKGNLFFSPNNDDRKMTGSYYTPDYIVKYIVENTLGPLVRNRTSAEILRLRVCDPAMGSGHFLSGTLDFLVSEYRKKWCEENNDDIGESIEATSRKIVDQCIYGVDINTRAVKLANMSLWLMTAFPGKKLEKLSDQLKSGNSLINQGSAKGDNFHWKNEFPHIFHEGGFDAIVGNPPYLGEKGHQKIFEEIKKSNQYTDIHDRRTNTYYYFLKLAHELLNPGGILGYIIPSEWKDNVSATKLRSYMASKCFELLTVDFHDLKVFKSNGKSVGTSSLICIYSKTQATTTSYRFDLSGKELQNLIDHDNLILTPLSYQNNSYQDCMEIFQKVNRVKLETAKKMPNQKINLGNNLSKVGDCFHVDQGIVTGADLVTKKNKYISENWKQFESRMNSGILILKVNQDIKLIEKELYLNLGTLSSPTWKKLNSDEKAVVKPLFKNKDLRNDGYYDQPSSYVIYFVDQQESLNLINMPTLKEHLENYKKVLTSSKTNCYHNAMLKNIMKPIVDRGNYFVIFYPRPKTDFEGEKIVFVCDQEGITFIYNNSSFYGSGGNKGGLSFITQKENTNLSLKYLYAYFLSDLYKAINKNRPSTQFLSGETVKDLYIPSIIDSFGTNLYELIVGNYTKDKKMHYKFHPSSGTFIKEKGLVDLYLEVVKDNKDIEVGEMQDSKLKKYLSHYKTLNKEKLLFEINQVFKAICKGELKKAA